MHENIVSMVLNDEIHLMIRRLLSQKMISEVSGYLAKDKDS